MRQALILLPVLAVSGDQIARAEATENAGAVKKPAGVEATAAATEAAAKPQTEAVLLAATPDRGQLHRRLFQAAALGDEAAVLAVLREGADLEARDLDGSSALMLAARAGHTGLVETLLARGADVEARDAMGKTPLMAAVEGRRVETTETLLKGGASVNALAANGTTALSQLCHGLQYLKDSPAKPAATRLTQERRATLLSLATVLLQYGANPNAQLAGVDGMPAAAPLAQAARAGDADLVTLFLAAGADPDGRPVAINTPAAEGTPAPLWETPLQAVLEAGNRARAEAALISDGGALAPSVRDELRAKAQQADLSIVRALVEAGARVDAGLNRFTVLAAAGGTPAAGTSLEVVKLLAAKGAALNSTDTDRRIALLEATGNGSTRLVAAPGQLSRPRLMARSEISPRVAPRVANAPTANRGPLRMAALGVPGAGNESTSAAGSLAAPQAKPQLAVRPQLSTPAGGPAVDPVIATRPAVRPWRYTAVARMEPQRHEPRLPASPFQVDPLTQLDRKHGQPLGRNALIEAARAGQVEIVNYLLEQGLDPNQRDSEGKTALMHVCGAGRAKWVRALPEKRAKALAGAPDSDPRLASRVVSYAENTNWRQWAELGDVAIVRALVKAGAKVDARDNLDRTALMYAARRSSPQVVRTLLGLGANVNRQDVVGKTALMQVIGGGRYVAAEGWVSPVLRAESQAAVTLAQLRPGYATTQLAAQKLDLFRLHRDLVVQEAERDDTLILYTLRRAGTDLNIRDKNGDTAVDLAVRAGQLHAVRWLMGNAR